jgi:hypothetical protein
MGIFTPVRDSSAPFTWGTVRYTPTTLTGTFDEVIATFPAGTIFLDVQMTCIRADAGAGNVTVDLELNAAGGTAIITGATDNAGTAGLTTTFADNAGRKTALDAMNASSLGGTAVGINAEVTIATGTSTTPCIMEISVLYGRTQA